MNVLKDQWLILRFRHGSREAFCRIYETYRDDLLRVAVRNTSGRTLSQRPRVRASNSSRKPNTILMSTCQPVISPSLQWFTTICCQFHSLLTDCQRLIHWPCQSLHELIDRRCCAKCRGRRHRTGCVGRCRMTAGPVG